MYDEIDLHVPLGAEANLLPCGCRPHRTRMSTFGTTLYCDTEQNAYCNFECPHEDEEDRAT